MKKIIFLCLFSITSSVSIFAISGPGAPGEIQKLFHHQFPKIEKAAFFSYGDAYNVYFKNENNSSEIVYYSLDGEIIKTMKYYSQSELEPFIREKVNREYKGKTISGVTEVASNTGHFYQIVLQDKNKWYTVNSDDKGSLDIETILKKD